MKKIRYKIKKSILLRKARREAAKFVAQRGLWKALTGWNRGGDAMPEYIATTELSSHKALREEAWHHYKMMRVYHIALIRLEKSSL